MKKLGFFILALALHACNKPAPIELQLENPDELLEVSTIAQGDSNLALASIDSSAILPADQERFAGMLQVARVTFDNGLRVVDTVFTRVMFENRLRPVRAFGRVIGYHGFNLGLVRITGPLGTNVLFPIPHRLGGRRDSVAGLEYVRPLAANEYQPRTLYTWTASPDSIGPISASIESPDNIVVQSPRGGILRRDRDLVLSWRGEGNLFFVISSYEPLARKSKPIFKVRVRQNRGRAVLSRKILQLLPPERIYVFTFVLENRKESETVQRYPWGVLVQATSMYNSYVELR